MLNGINRLRTQRTGVGRRGEAERRTDLPLDHQLTFQPEPDEKWTFEEGRKICINGEDVAEAVRTGNNDVRLLVGVSHGLSAYQQHVWGRGGKGNADFNGTVAALQSTIVGRMSNLYDGLTGGVHFEAVGEDFWVNNVNIRSVLHLYLQRPTDAGRRYLEGLREKLALILSRRQSSTRYDAVHGQAERLYQEVSMVLECAPPPGPPRLCA